MKTKITKPEQIRVNGEKVYKLVKKVTLDTRRHNRQELFKKKKEEIEKGNK